MAQLIIPPPQRPAFKCVDLFKFFFALCVVAIHTRLFSESELHKWINPLLFRLAVPYFFVASGFFLGLKVYSGGHYSGFDGWRKYFIRLLTKLFVFEPINTAANIIIMYTIYGLTAAPIFVQVIQHIIFAPWGALWYIQALIVAVIILIPVIKYRKEKLCLVMATALYLISLLGNRYYFLIEDTALQPIIDKYMFLCVSPRNGLFVGLLYVLLGLLLAKHRQHTVCMTATLTATAILYALVVIESILLIDIPYIDDGSLLISYPMFTTALFYLTTRINIKRIKDTTVVRNLSTSIYLLHYPVIYAITLSAPSIFGSIPANSYCLFSLTITLTAIICYPIYRYRKQPFYNWIR